MPLIILVLLFFKTSPAFAGLGFSDDAYWIYAWSPRMPLSVRGQSEARQNFKYIKQIGRNIKLKLCHDMPMGRSDLNFESAPCGKVLFPLGLNVVHFPTLIFVDSKRKTSKMVPGYQEPSIQMEYINRIEGRQ